VLLSLTEAPAESGRASGEVEAVPTPRVRVRVVEDENQVRAVVGRTLAELGYQVTEARHGEDALRHLEAPAGGWTWA
jgi:response regulator RpfG family c-di-GMP phosphodiesterase